MANTTIPNLPSAISLTGSEQLEVVQSGVSVKTTAQDIADLNANGGTVTSIATASPITGGTITSTGTISLLSQGVDNSYLALMAPNTIKGNNTVSAVSPIDLTTAEVMTMLSAAPLNSPTFTGTPLAPTASTSDNSQQIATTAFVKNQNYALQSTTISAGTGLTGGGDLSANRTLSLASIADSRVLANVSGSTAAPSATTLTSLLDSSFGTTQGSILYRGSLYWQGFSPGVAGQVLTSGGPAADPAWLTLGGTGTVQQINTGTGLTGGPITTVGTLAIANTGVSAGSYGASASVPVISINAQGQITSASSATINAVTLTTGTITTTPSNADDIANKAYVDSIAQGLNFHAACNYATTADLGTVTYNNGASGVGATLTNAGTQAVLVIDGHTFTTTDVTNAVRILVKNQSNSAYNGVYVLTNQGSVSTNWSMIRATDYDTSGTGTNEIESGDFFLVLSGTVNANTSWVQQTLLPIIVGTTSLVFTQFGAPVLYTAGTGLSLAGTQFNIANTAVTAASYGAASSVATFTVNAQGQLTAAASTPIAINGNQITSGTIGSAYLSGSYTGITGVGTLTTGTWNASAIGVAHGGTGLSSYTSGDMIYATGATTLTQLAAGTNGYILTMSAGLPAWSPAPATGVTSFQTSLSGLTPSSSTTGAVTLAGTLGETSGGTNQSTYAAGDILYASATNTLSKLAAGINGYILTLSAGLPSWQPNTGGVTSFSAGSTGLTPNTATTGAITLAGTLASGYGGTGFSTYTTGDLIYASATNTLAKLGIGTTGQALIISGGVPTWGAAGGATGGGIDQIFWQNGQTVNTSYSIPSNINAGSFGPITVSASATVTIPASSTWTVV